MGSPSKEKYILKLVLNNSPLKEWHFQEIIREAQVTKAIANKWLKKYVHQGLLKHVKEKGRFPYFTAGENNSVYYSFKKMYALEQLHSSGLTPTLLSLNNAKTIIIFGSIIRGDWYKDSDIDIFVLGGISGFDKHRYELKLGRQIELHLFEDKADIREIKTGLLKNIINGYILKGKIQDIAEIIL